MPGAGNLSTVVVTLVYSISRGRLMRIPAVPSSLSATAVLTEGDGPAVVLLHAFPLDRGMWASQVAALSVR